MHHKKALVSYGKGYIFSSKTKNDTHPRQYINTVMCHYCDTWLTPYAEVLLYEYVVDLRRLSGLNICCLVFTTC